MILFVANVKSHVAKFFLQVKYYRDSQSQQIKKKHLLEELICSYAKKRFSLFSGNYLNYMTSQGMK